nr:hypothetical protein GCM10020092_072820 [Actinoplanes digitatis]
MSRVVRRGLRRDRLAFAGMATVLLLLAVFAVSTAWRTSDTASSAARAGEIEEAYCDASDALDAERARLLEYHRSPSPENLHGFIAASAGVRATLARHRVDRRAA